MSAMHRTPCCAPVPHIVWTQPKSHLFYCCLCTVCQPSKSPLACSHLVSGFKLSQQICKYGRLFVALYCFCTSTAISLIFTVYHKLFYSIDIVFASAPEEANSCLRNASGYLDSLLHPLWMILWNVVSSY